MPDVHAMLSASSAARWIHCPPSALLAAEVPSTTSEYAEAGRLAHAIGELKARKYFLTGIGLKKYAHALTKLQEDPHYAPEMDEATDQYLDALKEQAFRLDGGPFAAFETRVSYDDIAPGGFGTADAVLIAGDTIVVCDYKNGAGVPVEAEENPQLMLYAWGAIRAFESFFPGITKVRLVIIQPHAGGVKVWDTTREALTDWAYKTVKPAAALAAKGEGDFHAGEWCGSHFCPLRATCRHRAEHLLEAGRRAPALPPELTDTEVGNILAEAKELVKWVKDLEDYAICKLLAGGEIPGFKLVEGRKSREWAGGTDAAFAELVLRGMDEALLFERKPVSVAGLEKAMGKAAFGTLAEDLVTVKPGKPTMVSESDKRQPYDPARAAFRVVAPDD